MESNFDIVTDEKERANMHKEKVIKYCDNMFPISYNPAKCTVLYSLKVIVTQLLLKIKSVEKYLCRMILIRILSILLILINILK